MTKKILHIIFTEQEITLLKDLIDAEGYHGMSEVIRLAVREFHEKKFSKYKKTPPKEVPSILTPEQLCAELGGIVVEENGVQYCRIEEGAITTDKPLSMLE